MHNKNNTKSKVDSIQEAKRIEESINEALAGVKTGKSTKDIIIAGYLSLAMQHHSSIILLIENNLSSSAAALGRPLLEACYRGTWFELVCDDEIAKKFNEGEYQLKLTYILAKEIDQYIEQDETNDVDTSIFHHIYEQNSSTLHGMTHGGMEQIGRQLSEDGETIISTFSDEALVELLISSNSLLAMTLLAFGKNIDDRTLISIARKLILT